MILSIKKGFANELSMDKKGGSEIRISEPLPCALPRLARSEIRFQP